MGILSRLWAPPVRAATPENPSFGLSDPAAWDSLLSGPAASSGVRVSPESALAYSPWWRGISLIAGYCAKTPLLTYRLDDDGDLAEDREHPAWPLCRWKANPYQSAFHFRQQLTAHALSAGNGYAYVYRDGGARPLELWPLDPHSTYPVREISTADGLTTSRLWYVVEVGGAQRKLAAEDVLHVKGLGFDGLTGYSVVSKAAEEIGLGLAAQKYQSIVFKNAGRPSVVLQTDQQMPPNAKTELREAWERMHTGLDNAHRTAILDRGLKANPLAFNAEDSQLIETRQFNVLDVANRLGLPPHKLGHPGQSGYNSLELENQAFLDDTLGVWFSIWEGECRDKLLTEEEKGSESHEVRYFTDDLLRADMGARSNFYRAALAGRPWMTQNDVRAREHLPRSDDPEADKLAAAPPAGPPQEPPPILPAKKTPPAAPPKKAEADPALAAALRRNLEDAARRVVRRISLHAKRASKDGAAFCEWLDTFRKEHSEVAGEMLAPAVDAVSAHTGRPAAGCGSAHFLFDRLGCDLDDAAANYTADRLPDAVEAICAAAERDHPAQLAAELMGDA